MMSMNMRKRAYLVLLMGCLLVTASLLLPETVCAKVIIEKIEEKALKQDETEQEKKTGFYDDGKGNCYYYDADGNMVTSKMIQVKKQQYYCTKSGKLKRGWLRYKGGRYYFYENYSMARNVILKQKYKINKKGELVETFNKKIVEARKIAEQVVKKVTNKNMSKSQKLYAAYKYVVKNTSYNGDSPSGKRNKKWGAKCAIETLRNKAGECYGFSAVFVYLAKVIGYEDAHLCIGSTMSANYPWAPHGWAEITIKGTKYLFDPEIEFKNGTCGKLYKKQYHEVSRKYRVGKKIY